MSIVHVLHFEVNKLCKRYAYVAQILSEISKNGITPTARYSVQQGILEYEFSTSAIRL